MKEGPRTVLIWTAAINAGLFAAIGISHIDREALAFAVLYLIGLALAHVGGRRGLIGTVGLGLLSLDTLLWMAAATLANLQSHEAILAVLQPLVLTVTSSVAIVTAAMVLIQRPARISGGWLPLGVATVGVFALTLVAESVLASAASGPSGGVTLTIHNTAYSSTALSATSGQVTVDVTNQDLFWHTFTIDKLGVNVAVPVGGHRQATFTAPPGTYTFYCAIPGHRQAGMHGTITIR